MPDLDEYIPHYLAVRARDDDAPTTSDDYAAFFDLLAEDGTLIMRIAADAVHQHGGIYTRLHPLDHESDKKVKRVNYKSGVADSEARFMSAKGASSRVWVDADAQAIHTLTAGDERIDLYLTPDGRLRIDDHDRKNKLLDFNLAEGVVSFGECVIDPDNLPQRSDGGMAGEVEALESRVAELEATLAEVASALERQ